MAQDHGNEDPVRPSHQFCLGSGAIKGVAEIEKKKKVLAAHLFKMLDKELEPVFHIVRNGDIGVRGRAKHPLDAHINMTATVCAFNVLQHATEDGIFTGKRRFTKIAPGPGMYLGYTADDWAGAFQTLVYSLYRRVQLMASTWPPPK